MTNFTPVIARKEAKIINEAARKELLIEEREQKQNRI